MTKSKHRRSKKEQRLFDNLLRATYEFIKGKAYAPQSKESLIERLRIHERHLDIFDTVLKSLKKEGRVHMVGKEYHHVPEEEGEEEEEELITTYGSAEEEEVVRGVLSVHIRGFGFVNQPAPKDDIFIPKRGIRGAVDGDVVDVCVTPSMFVGKGPEGNVLAIVRRKHKQIVGTVMVQHKNTVHIYSGLLGELHIIQCPLPKKQKLLIGDRVILDVQHWGPHKEPQNCTISSILGSVDDPSIDLPFVIAESGLRDQFPDAVVKEAESFGTRVKSSDFKDRIDLRHLECVTIDPDTAKDFDDAISVEKIGTSYRLGVHIADVSNYVRPGTLLDIEALLRCNSTYFPNTCIPMLPKALSERLCSLRPNVNRLAVSVFIDIDETGETKDWEIVRSVIRSRKRFTYKEVKAVLDGVTSSPYNPVLLEMHNLCNLLKHQRSQRGSVQLYIPEVVVKVDESGRPQGIEIVEYDITHQMVEEFMLKANELVAIHLARKGKDLSYRVHEAPAEESLADFSVLASSYGFSLPDVPTPHDIQRFFLEIQGTSHAAYLATCYIKSMRLACYSPDNIGHYGLSLEHYCHFTSPIRRYVDLVVHRLLFEDGPDRLALSSICVQASEKERISARAEGSLVTMKKLRLLAEQRKQDPRRQYQAIITRVKPFGIFFDVLEIMLEGFLHVSDLEDDYYIFDDMSSELVGRHEDISYGCGEHLIVVCQEINLVTQQASWYLVGREQEQKKRRKKKKKKKNTGAE